MSKASVKAELRALLQDIDHQMVEVGKVARDLGCHPHQVKNMDGSFMMIPLLVARAQVLAAIAGLEK